MDLLVLVKCLKFDGSATNSNISIFEKPEIWSTNIMSHDEAFRHHGNEKNWSTFGKSAYINAKENFKGHTPKHLERNVNSGHTNIHMSWWLNGFDRFNT